MGDSFSGGGLSSTLGAFGKMVPDPGRDLGAVAQGKMPPPPVSSGLGFGQGK